MDFSNDESLNKMQREAIERAREMHRRASSLVAPTEGEQTEADQKSTPKELFNLQGIKIDEEKALIGMLIYILYKNGGDHKLILALLYLLI